MALHRRMPTARKLAVKHVYSLCAINPQGYGWRSMAQSAGLLPPEPEDATAAAATAAAIDANARSGAAPSAALAAAATAAAPGAPTGKPRIALVSAIGAITQSRPQVTRPLPGPTCLKRSELIIQRNACS